MSDTILTTCAFSGVNLDIDIIEGNGFRGADRNARFTLITINRSQDRGGYELEELLICKLLIGDQEKEAPIGKQVQAIFFLLEFGIDGNHVQIRIKLVLFGHRRQNVV